MFLTNSTSICIQSVNVLRKHILHLAKQTPAVFHQREVTVYVDMLQAPHFCFHSQKQVQYTNKLVVIFRTAGSFSPLLQCSNALLAPIEQVSFIDPRFPKCTAAAQTKTIQKIKHRIIARNTHTT